MVLSIVVAHDFSATTYLSGARMLRLCSQPQLDDTELLNSASVGGKATD